MTDIDRNVSGINGELRVRAERATHRGTFRVNGAHEPRIKARHRISALGAPGPTPVYGVYASLRA